MEILAPAGGPASVAAAVQNGADAIYLGYGSFHARQSAAGFTSEEMGEALTYCRTRGVRVYAALNTLLTDRELPQAAALVEELCRTGVDAFLVQDLGVLRMVNKVAPGLPVHASTQMSLHTLEGLQQAHALGLSRAVLARELSREQIAYICKHSPIEVEVFVHGALCVCYSGQCYMSAVIGERGGNRGQCAGPCRLPYGFDVRAEEYPLSVKDLSLIDHLVELKQMGVACVKIEGRMRRPEYVALATRAVFDGLSGHGVPEADRRALERVFSRQGFTDGYYMKSPGPDMLGIYKPEPPDRQDKFYANIRSSYEGEGERQRVPVKLACLLAAGQPAALGVEDGDGHTVTVHGPTPNPAYDHTLPEAMVETQLYKTGGTPYLCVEARARVEEGLSLPLSAINAMRREALAKLTELRRRPPVRETGEWKAGLKALRRRDPPVFTFQVARAEQITPELAALKPSVLYVPITEFADHSDFLAPVIAAGIPVAVALPRVFGNHEAPEIRKLLDRAKALGVNEALAGNLGQLALAQGHGFRVRGDFGLNVTNSQTLKTLKQLGLISATLSFELSLAQVRDLSHAMDTELIVYGRLPLMLTEQCLVLNHTGRCTCDNKTELVDRVGAHFPLLREYKCRSGIYNSRKLFLADKAADWRRVGLWGARLLFTTENPRECVQAAERYLGRGSYEPNDFTRGLYYRGVL